MSPVQTLSLKNYFWRSEKRKVRKIYRILKLELDNLKGIFLGLSYSGFSKCPFS